MLKVPPTTPSAFYKKQAQLFSDYGYQFYPKAKEEDKKKWTLDLFGAIYAMVDYQKGEDHKTYMRMIVQDLAGQQRGAYTLGNMLPYVKYLGLSIAEEKELEVVLSLLSRANASFRETPMDIDWSVVSQDFTDGRRHALTVFMKYICDSVEEPFDPGQGQGGEEQGAPD